MKIYIAADHRGFNRKNELLIWLKQLHYSVIDCGNLHFDPLDDYTEYAFVLTKQMNPESDKGIVLCGSGIGVCMAVNRINNFRCALGFTEDQIRHGVEKDHINVLSIACDYFDLDTTKQFITIFLASKSIMEEKYIRRVKKLDNIK